MNWTLKGRKELFLFQTRKRASMREIAEKKIKRVGGGRVEGSLQKNPGTKQKLYLIITFVQEVAEVPHHMI